MCQYSVCVVGDDEKDEDGRLETTLRNFIFLQRKEKVIHYFFYVIIYYYYYFVYFVDVTSYSWEKTNLYT